ncbi:hypothetical protein KBD45_03655 [Candidatus Dojkabacteria bacterium]|nr:hypothetical protein [Candidatus Dojkabacteria bacterium]
MVSPTIHFDHNVKKLTYTNVGKIDVKIFEEYKDAEILDMSHGLFEDLPKELSKLKKLKILFLSYGKIRKVPDVVRELESLDFFGARSCKIESLPEDCFPESLRWLTLTDNRIDNLPKSLGKLTGLKKLLLTRNEISLIPREILYCQNLELLRISLNKLAVSPLSTLSDLPNLSWYSDSDNLYNRDRSTNTLKKYDLESVKVLSTIVDNQNSRVDRILINKNNAILKSFKKEFVSDGSSTNEIMINSRLGKHPNIMTPFGYFEDQNRNLNGLIVEDLSKEFVPIASPPNFVSCTRDIYKNITLTKESGKKVIRLIKEACDYLHGLGIMHGDIYGHNTYLNLKNSEIKIGDFGASSIIFDKDAEIRRIIDNRAIDILTREISDLCIS